MSFIEKLARSLYVSLGTSLGNLCWYGVLAGGVWLFFSVVFRTKFHGRRISLHEPTRLQIAQEIVWSLRSIAIFGLVTGGVVFAAYSGWTRLYVDVDRHGWGWFILSIGVMIVLHDTYFYWTHRLMHHPRLYRVVHQTHHLSTSPTAWAAYACVCVRKVGSQAGAVRLQ